MPSPRAEDSSLLREGKPEPLDFRLKPASAIPQVSFAHQIRNPRTDLLAVVIVSARFVDWACGGWSDFGAMFVRGGGFVCQFGLGGFVTPSRGE